MNREPIGVAWFTNMIGTIGIVVSGPSPFDENYDARISIVTGKNEFWDIKMIQASGATFPVDQAIQIIKEKGRWLTKNEFNS